MTPSVQEIRNAQRAESCATILAIGTANPQNYFYQKDIPDFYFRITKSEHMIKLKEKFKRICDKTMIEKRYMVLTEDILKKKPNMCTYKSSSTLDIRQEIAISEVPRLGAEAALKAIKEWGQPISNITHIIFCTISGVDMPGADYQLTNLLGLNSTVKRIMMYQLGCYGGGTVLRLAKDIGENNKGARILVVTSELSSIWFHGPTDTHLDSMVCQALFGDGAAAVIVGADPNSTENPVFEMIWTGQTILPGSEGTLGGRLKESGLDYFLNGKIPALISNNIDKVLVEAFDPLGISDWNSIFWVALAHPGGPAILDQIETKLDLLPEKLKGSRQVLKDYGNMSSCCVLFILDEMRKKSMENGCFTTGEGLEWGVLFGFGPGLTVETVVLHNVPTVVN